MKILVVGCRGFLGSYFVNYFSKVVEKVSGCDFGNYYPVDYLYFPISKNEDYGKFFGREHFDICINAAGIGDVAFSVNHPLQDFESNTALVASLLEGIRLSLPDCKFLQISSAAVYGEPESIPISENDRLNPISSYGFNKVMAETLCREYHSLYNLKIAIIRPFSVFGSGLKKQLLWDLCEKCKNGHLVTLSGTGNETRDFIHVQDLARLIELIVRKSDFELNIYNAASGIEVAIKDIAFIFNGYFPGQKTFIFSGVGRTGDPVKWKADISQIQNLGFNATVIFEKGVRDYIDTYIELYGK